MLWKGCLLLMLALTGPGCLSSGTTHVNDASRRPPPVRIVESPPPPPPAVTADQVNESNAADMGRALAREMDYDANAAPAMANVAPFEAGEVVDLTPATKGTNANQIKH